MSYAIGVDLGGTNIKIAVVSHDGEVLEYSTCETADDATGSWAEMIKQKIGGVQNQRGEPASHIGLAAPGLAARDGLSIANMQGRLQGLEGLVWTDFLRTPRAVLVLNDAHAALLGEVWKGAAAGFSNVVLLTLGTGVGGAILADGRLVKGHIGRAGHLGHICLNPDGPPDIVGTPGSLEEMIGNCTLIARSGGRFTSTRQLVEAHLAGDSQATDIWLRSVYHLAVGITSIINAFDPEVIILGGGIARAGSALFGQLSRFMEQVEWRPLGHRVPIIPAALSDQAGALGAVYHAFRGNEETFL
ncbi:MAG: ROK family protein [Blastocatellia bacterium]|nr:ROK family protein [Blastocatellia bacterium]